MDPSSSVPADSAVGGYLADCSGRPAGRPRLRRCPRRSQSTTGPAAAQWLRSHGPAGPGPCTHKRHLSLTADKPEW